MKLIINYRWPTLHLVPQGSFWMKMWRCCRKEATRCRGQSYSHWWRALGEPMTSSLGWKTPGALMRLLLQCLTHLERTSFTPHLHTIIRLGYKWMTAGKWRRCNERVDLQWKWSQWIQLTSGVPFKTTDDKLVTWVVFVFGLWGLTVLVYCIRSIYPHNCI